MTGALNEHRIQFAMNAIATSLASLMILGWYSEITAQGSLDLPNMFVCEQLGYPILYAFYSITLFMAFVSTSVTTIFALVNRFDVAIDKKKKNSVLEKEIPDEKNGKKIYGRRIILSVAIILVCMSISTFGLSNIVKYAYNYTGYIGIAFIIIPVLTILHNKNKKYLVDNPGCLD